MFRPAKLIISFYTEKATKFANSVSNRSTWYVLAPLTGSFWYKLGDSADSSQGISKFGDIVICPPNWNFYRSSPEPLEFLVLIFEWDDEYGSSMDEDFQKPFGNISLLDLPRHISTLERFRDINHRGLPGLQTYKTHLLNDLLFACLLQQENLNTKTNDPLMLNAAHYLEEHAFEPISLLNISNKTFLSQSQFCRRFKSAVGVSPIQFLTEIRLKKAKSLLLETDWGIDSISVECGYNNGFYLSRVFTKKFGVNPSKYRDMYRI